MIMSLGGFFFVLIVLASALVLFRVVPREDPWRLTLTLWAVMLGVSLIMWLVIYQAGAPVPLDPIGWLTR